MKTWGVTLGNSEIICEGEVPTRVRPPFTTATALDTPVKYMLGSTTDPENVRLDEDFSYYKVS